MKRRLAVGVAIMFTPKAEAQSRDLQRGGDGQRDPERLQRVCDGTETPPPNFDPEVCERLANGEIPGVNGGGRDGPGPPPGGDRDGRNGDRMVCSGEVEAPESFDWSMCNGLAVSEPINILNSINDYLGMDMDMALFFQESMVAVSLGLIATAF